MHMLKISLAAARKNAKLTQAEAAKKLEIAVSTLKNWEKGKFSPSVNQAYSLCELYGIPIDAIKFPK